MDKEITFLQKHRYHKNANTIFRLSLEDVETIEFATENWIHQLDKFINRHKSEQVLRLLELKRYYLADNNIKYKPAKTDEFVASGSSMLTKLVRALKFKLHLGQQTIP